MRVATPLVASLALLPSAWGRIKYLGVAIPGIDFGCDIDGSCPPGNRKFPLLEMGGGDGAGQMQHWTENADMNTFRLPVPWQYLVNNQLGAKMDETNFDNYNKLMKACLDTGSYCMIDIHNFARWNDGIVGQGGPDDEEFVDIWVQLAKKYADNDKVMFGIVNEPHDLDIVRWAQTCQKVVTGIRKAGAESQIILLPGTNFASAETFVSSGSAELLAKISNPDGSKDGLVLDLHKYLDINNSGTHVECTTNNVAGFKTIGDWLRKNKRQAIISETGASLDPTCIEKFCTQNEYIAKNTDVFVGFVGWGAGSFGTDYVMNLTPSGEADNYQDNELMTECIIKPFVGEAPKSTATEEKTSTETASKTKSTASTATTTPSTNTANQIFKETPSHSGDESSETSAASEESNSEDDDGSAANPRMGSPAVGATFAIAMSLFFGMRLV
ncbi:glycoside hydrolase superfamily [Emericellopsis atlantica]|uniref:Endoglucanase EG-II n=1 Tax=Emericellopsis atlantica TaxID=2614577 RepID=A0A9P7ZWH0_9HYPO|nr:glycoside hydrolase superfamily [Emericellopsis atlantica]KAG9258798.1 glycoside hydrolase superfamily [Emericellopsis atlantica]